MKIILNDSQTVEVRHLSFLQWRQFMSEFMARNPNASLAWDLMGCVRGPDSPSERPDMTSSESAAAYAGRRKRKYNTVEIIREAMFFGSVGGAARYHKDSKVTLPNRHSYDHFDKHVERGANAIGLKVVNENA